MNTRRAILEELRISRKIVARGMEVTPRFVVYSPIGTHTLMLPLPDEESERMAHFRLARLFMIWKAVSGFILSTELKIPDAITATLVTRDEVTGASQLLSRVSYKFCGAGLVWARGCREGDYRPPAREVRAADCRRAANNREIPKRHCARTAVQAERRRRIKMPPQRPPRRQS